MVQGFVLPLGKSLQIACAPAVTQDPEHRHQKQEPLWVAYPAAAAPVWDGFEKADQVIRYGLTDCCRGDFGHWERGIPPTKANADALAKSYADRPLGGPVCYGSPCWLALS
jgi:hypothetical protein